MKKSSDTSWFYYTFYLEKDFNQYLKTKIEKMVRIQQIKFYLNIFNYFLFYFAIKFNYHTFSLTFKKKSENKPHEVFSSVGFFWSTLKYLGPDQLILRIQRFLDHKPCWYILNAYLMMELFQWFPVTDA